MAIKNILLFAAGAAAHFGLPYPEWRADTLNADEDSGYDQRAYPCKSPPFLSYAPPPPLPLPSRNPPTSPSTTNTHTHQVPTSPGPKAPQPTGPSPAAP